jgi:hypothetical protein
VNRAAFSPDGNSVLTAGDDLAAIWSTELSGSVQALEQIADRRLNRGLTRQERASYGVGG